MPAAELCPPPKCSPAGPASDSDLGAGDAQARAEKGLRWPTLAIGLRRIGRGKHDGTEKPERVLTLGMKLLLCIGGFYCRTKTSGARAPLTQRSNGSVNSRLFG